MTPRGRPNLMRKGHLWDIDSKRPQDVFRTFSRGPSKHVFGMMPGHLLDVPKLVFNFFLELIRLTKSIYKQVNTQGVFRTQSNL